VCYSIREGFFWCFDSPGRGLLELQLRVARWEMEPKDRDYFSTCTDYSTLRQESKIVGLPDQLYSSIK